MLGLVLGSTTSEKGALINESRYNAGLTRVVATAFETFKHLHEASTTSV